ncbi:LTA synthase family protein [Lacrimispora sp.]|uniref:LTA synthase family protein n=1 Tax=Lacrimispora sp. TaxID=2719234 RepID=UPI0028581C99|nr:sulfatase-like hydrolase/transferase [Lacrimispora sp.]MDR7814996.1 sulfatase-like hydrolase/transferase [Lacrimispora sp.]
MKKVKYSRIQLTLFIISLVTVIAGLSFFIKHYFESSDLSVKFLIQNDETRNYRIYYDDLNIDYPFGECYADGIIEGSSEIQSLEVSIPRNRIKNLRLDLGLGKTSESTVTLYKIQFIDLYSVKEISGQNISKYFEGINGAVVERLETSLNIFINGEGQYIVSNKLLTPEIVNINYFKLFYLLIIVLLLTVFFYIMLEQAISIFKRIVLFRKNIYNTIKSFIIKLWDKIRYKKNVILFLTLLTTIFLNVLILRDIKENQKVKIDFTVETNQSVDYIFYYNNLSGQYEFGNGYNFSGKTDGKEGKQILTFEIPYNRIDKLRFDFKYSGNIMAPIFISDIYLEDLLTNRIIPGKYVSQYFQEANGAEIERLDDSLKVQISDDNQYILITEYPEPIIVSYNTLHIVILIFIECIAYILVFLFFNLMQKGLCLRYYQDNIYTSCTIHTLLVAYIINIVLFSSYVLQYEDLYNTLTWITKYPVNYLLSFIFLFLISLFIYIISGRIWVSTLVVGVTAISSVLVNHYKLMYRGSPFFPWDVTLISEVKSVIGGIKIELNYRMIGILAVAIILVIFTYKIPPLILRNSRQSLKIKGISLCLVSLLIFAFVRLVYLNDYFTVNDWDPQQTYKDYGFFNAYLAEIRSMEVNKPSGYSKRKMEEVRTNVYELIKDSNVNNEVVPNIIIIMSESFWDVSKLPYVKDDPKELFPTLTSLRETSISGNLLCSIFGGGTSSTEFEVLTGFTKEFMPIESTPYLQVVNREFSSFPLFVKTLGYKTTAIHSFLRENWNRNVAYPNMGFDKFISQDDFIEPEIKRSFISDNEVTNKIIEEYERHVAASEQPWLNFTVTVQNHPGYSSDRWDSSELIDIEYENLSEDVVSGLKDFTTGLHHSDKALGKLIDYFSDIEKPTIIIFFGDHMTGFGDYPEKSLEQAGYLSPNMSMWERKYKIHLTPFMVWSNYMYINKNLGDVSSYQLLPTVLELYNLKQPTFYKFLNVLYKESPGLALGVVLNPDGTHSNTLNEKQQELYELYKLIQYDYIYGNNYLGNEFFGY